MGKYGNGITFGKACNMEKEEIRHALKNEGYACDDEFGNPVYVPITKE